MTKIERSNPKSVFSSVIIKLICLVNIWPVAFFIVFLLSHFIFPIFAIGQQEYFFTINFTLTITSYVNLIALLGYVGFGLYHFKQKAIRKRALKSSLVPLVGFFICLLEYAFLAGATFVGKPVIYFYPEQPQLVEVKLDFAGELIVTYPKYGNGWKVFAHPDGKIIDLADNKEYSYLFWEGKDKGASYDLTSGFVVKGSETANFLQEKLSALGLTPKEYNEFIVYWLPLMQDNKYNLIHFASKEEYDDRAILNITPKPDSVLRVFMTFKALNHKVEVTPQEIKPFERNGFTVVEWGGTEIE